MDERRLAGFCAEMENFIPHLLKKYILNNDDIYITINLHRIDDKDAQFILNILKRQCYITRDAKDILNWVGYNTDFSNLYPYNGVEYTSNVFRFLDQFEKEYKHKSLLFKILLGLKNVRLKCLGRDL